MKTLQELPKCPKCGEEPELYSYYANGGKAWGVSLMCRCKELCDTVPFSLQKTLIMRMNRCTRQLERQWAKYVKEWTMKEHTRVFTAQITQIAMIPDELSEDFITTENAEMKLANFVKRAIDADDVVVDGIKTFVREVT